MKYIVYKTTNKVNNFIYIGVHNTPNPDVFDGYIGCGVNIFRESTYAHPKTSFQIAVKEYGVNSFHREIISVFNTPEEAYNLESELVNSNFLARSDVYNMVLGGMYNSLNNSIKVYQYDSNGNYIKTYDSIIEAANENKRSTTIILKSWVYKTKCGDYYYNTDKVDKLDLSNYKVVTPIKVYRYLVNGGKLDKEYPSFSSAADDTFCTSCEVSRSGKLGYRVGNYYFCTVKADSYDVARKIYINNRKVFKYDNTGNFIKAYATQHEAELDNLNSNITKSIKNKKPDKNGFLWSLEELPKYCRRSNSKKQPVGMFDLDGNLIKTWDSVKACILETGIDRQKVTYERPVNGFVYKHIEMTNILGS